MTTTTTNLVEQPIYLPESSYPAKYFLTLKSTDHNKWKERWECMLWEPKENYSHHPHFDPFTLISFILTTIILHSIPFRYSTHLLGSKHVPSARSPSKR